MATAVVLKSISARQSEQVDVFRAICAMLVVSIHVPIQASRIGAHSLYGQWLAVWHEGIARLAVPSFFLLSGYFVAKHLDGLTCKSYAALLLKKVKTLLVPYIVMNIAFWVLVSFCAAVASGVSGGGRIKAFDFGQIVDAIGLPGVSQPINFSLWFLRCLMYFMLLLPAIGCIALRGKKWAMTLTIAGFAVSQSILTGALPACGVNWRTGFDIYGFCWFITGIVLRLYPMNIRVNTRRIYCGLVILTMIVFALLRLRFGAGSVLSLFWKYILLIPVCAYAVWRLSASIEMPALLKRNTMPIYLLQIPVYFIFGVAAAKLHIDLSESGIAGYFAMVVAVTMISVFVAEVARKYLPNMSAICFGAR